MIDLTNQFLSLLNLTAPPSFQTPPPQVMQIITIITSESEKLQILMDQESASYIGDRIQYGAVMSSTQAVVFESMISQRLKLLNQQLDQVLSFIMSISSKKNQDENLQLDVQIAQEIMLSQSGYLLRLFEGMATVTRHKVAQVAMQFVQLRKQRLQNFTAPTKVRPVNVQSQQGQIQVEEQEDDYFSVQNNQVLQPHQQSVLADLINEREQALNIQRNVHEIEDMQQLFSENLHQQSQQINRVYYTTVKSESNLEIANRHLVRAKKNLRSSTKETVVLLVLSIFGIWFLDYSRR